jgi:CRISPR-associated protein Cpf1
LRYLHTKREEYSALVKKTGDLIKKSLPKWMHDNGYSAGDIRLLKDFDGFTSYFIPLTQNRVNMYSVEAQGTAISNRAVNENFSKYVSNKRIVNLIVKEAANALPSMSVDYIAQQYNKFLSPDDINAYNKVIGELSSVINEAYQQKLISKRYRLFDLYKQILCEGERQFNTPIQFDNDVQVFKTIDTFIEDSGIEGLPSLKDVILKTYNQLEYADWNHVYIADKKLFDLSRVLHGAGKIIPDAIAECGRLKIGPMEGATKKEAEQWENRKSKFYSLRDVEDAVFAVPSNDISSLEGVVSALKNECEGVFAAIDCALMSYRKVEQKYFSDKKNENQKLLLSKDSDIEVIKNLLDELKNLEWLLQIFKADKQEDKDATFYADFDKTLHILENVDSVYNKVRNYLTQKPFSQKKIKLNFECPTLAAGWDLNKEETNLCIILRRSGKYYLGIMNKESKTDFSLYACEDNEEYYEKMFCKNLTKVEANLPRIFISAKNASEKYQLSEDLLKGYKEGRHKKAANDVVFCHQLIDYFKVVLRNYPGWEVFDYESKLSPTGSYADISEFYSEVAENGFYLDYERIRTKDIDKLVEDGSLYLFQIYNKDYSDYATGSKNLHTLYWEEIFTPENAQHGYKFRLNGDAELFYRPASIKTPFTHKKGSVILNKTYTDDDGVRKTIKDDIYLELCAILAESKTTEDVPEEIKPDVLEMLKLLDEGKLESKITDRDIVKDRRYTQDKYAFHVPITINATAKGSGNKREFNQDVLQFATDNDITILGIDRGERHLLYATLIDKSGNILMQRTFNTVSVTQKDSTVDVDYHDKLDIKEKARDKARKNWKSIDKIADLKQGYLSQVVHEIAQIAAEYNAIVVMEDLNFGFKRGRFKVEKQVYQKFEKQLIDRLSYLAEKPNSNKGIWDQGGIAQAYQLVPKFDSFRTLGKQHGVVFYVPAWNTSHIDPTTGFMNLFRFPKDTKEAWYDFFSHMDSIVYNAVADYFEFGFKYSSFGDTMVRRKDERDEWKVCSFGDKRLVNRKDNGKWRTDEINVNQRLKDLFNEEGIDYSDGRNLKDDIASLNKIKDLGWLFKTLLDLRNSETGETEDYILSPVKNKDGYFFDSREAGTDLPKDADANGAYHIALKGLQYVEGIQEKNSIYSLSKDVSTNAAWTTWIQKFHER